MSCRGSYITASLTEVMKLRYVRVLNSELSHIVSVEKCKSAKMREERWMDEFGFYVPSTVFQSFRDDGRVHMKGSVQ